jgi:hypothetical protein
MTVHLPNIGITSCHRAEVFLEKYPEYVVGSFWVMAGYGFGEIDIPSWWIDNIFKENQAQGIIDAFKRGLFGGEHNNSLYLGYCIIVVADPSNPISLSYMIQHLRMWGGEGIGILEIMAIHNIPVQTEVTYPEQFMSDRYGYNIDKNTTMYPIYTHLSERLEYWSVQVWEDYCSYLMAVNGQSMLVNYYRKNNKAKVEVQETIKKDDKPLVLTEGETDPIYIRTALKVLGKNKLLEQLDIEWVGTSIGKGKSINTGDSGLNSTRDVLLANPQFLTRKVLLIYDCDTKKPDEDHENLKIRKIPQQNNRKVKKGIENLFPDHLFTENFYVNKSKYGDYGEEIKFQEFQKMKFCEWICTQRQQAKDFADFVLIVNILKEFIS